MKTAFWILAIAVATVYLAGCSSVPSSGTEAAVPWYRSSMTFLFDPSYEHPSADVFARANDALQRKAREVVVGASVECFLVPSMKGYELQIIARRPITEGEEATLRASVTQLMSDAAEESKAWRRLNKKPNQALQPTPTAGTSAAEQPLVPAAVVADL
jgi:hypothetical protein